MTTTRRLALTGFTVIAALAGFRATAWAAPINLRMGVTDRSTAQELQPRIWMRNNDSALVAKDADQSTWTKIGGLTIASAPDAVSWLDATHMRQRVFFIQNNQVQMLNYDDSLVNGQLALPAVTGLTFQSTMVKSTLWSNGGVLTITVVATAIDAVSSRAICAYETPAASSTTSWQVWCSASAAANGIDIAAVPASPPRFFFISPAGGLRSLVRVATATYGVQVITLPSGVTSIGNSLVAYADGANHQVGIISNTDHRIWAGIVSTSGTTPSWTELPALPGGVVPLTSNTQLGGEVFNPPDGTINRSILVVGGDGKLYRINRTSATWPASWNTGLLPGSLQTFLGIGVTVGEGMFSQPHTFLIVGPSITVMQELNFGQTTLVDHIAYGVGLARAETALANESSAALTGSIGAVSAIQRNTTPPWNTRMAQITSSGAAWGATLTVAHRAPYNSGFVRSASDPVFAAGAGNVLHYVDLDWDMTTGCTYADQAGSGATTPLTMEINYRRGTSVLAIANSPLGPPDFFHIAGPGNLDHPFIGVTGNIYAQGVQSAVWVLYADVGAGKTMQWTLANGVATPPRDVSSFVMTGAPVVFSNQTNAYGAQGIAAFGRICQLAVNANPTACGTLDNGSTTDPVPVEPDLSFGPALASQAGLCPSRNNQWYDCYGTAQPVSFATDPNATTISVFAAYHGYDPTAALGADGRRPLSVYFIKNTNNSLTSWTTPVRVHTRTGQEDDFDPEITVDAEGTIVISYQQTTRAPIITTSSRVDTRVAWSTLANPTVWTPGNAGASYAIWFGASLPYHCRRKQRFMGEYRNPSVVGGRAFHPLVAAANTTTPTQLNGMWFNKETIR